MKLHWLIWQCVYQECTSKHLFHCWSLIFPSLRKRSTVGWGYLSKNFINGSLNGLPASTKRSRSPFSVRVVSGSIIFWLAAGIKWKMLMMAAHTFKCWKRKQRAWKKPGRRFCMCNLQWSELGSVLHVLTSETTCPVILTVPPFWAVVAASIHFFKWVYIRDNSYSK